MANRQNFSRPVRFEIAKRATRSDGQMACERCGAVGCRLELHHKRMDALVFDEDKASRKLTAADGEMICQPCHKAETADQRKALARVEAAQERHLGVRQTRAKIASRGFAAAPRAQKRLSKEKRCAGPSAFARRFGLKEDA